MTKRKKKVVAEEPNEPEETTEIPVAVLGTVELIDIVNKEELKALLDTAPELRGDWDIQGAAYVENFRVKYAEFLAELTKLAS
jgi:hypothetical protein